MATANKPTKCSSTATSYSTVTRVAFPHTNTRRDTVCEVVLITYTARKTASDRIEVYTCTHEGVETFVGYYDEISHTHLGAYVHPYLARHAATRTHYVAGSGLLPGAECWARPA